MTAASLGILSGKVEHSLTLSVPLVLELVEASTRFDFGSGHCLYLLKIFAIKRMEASGSVK